MIQTYAIQWHPISKALHWLLALLIFVQFTLGWLAKTWRLSPVKLDLFVWHKSIGILILGLVLVRIGWRLLHQTPSLPTDLPAWESWAARANQFLLYALILAMPISGWIINSAANIPFRIFWWLDLPDITTHNKALASDAKLWHLMLFILLLATVLLHIAAALKHHFYRHNDILKRMLPEKRS